MFGLSKMYQERDKLYMRCKRQQAKAGADRMLLKKQTLEAASSTKGLLVSFVLGLTTQCESAHATRKTVLRGIQTELFGVIGQYVATRLNASGETHSSKDSTNAK